MKCRNATLVDAEQISVVLKECYNIDSNKEGKKVFLTEVKKQYRYIVAVEKGKVAGITSWQMHGLPKHMVCELDRIAVLSEYRGKGVAKQLFDALVKSADAEYKKYGFRMRKLYLLTHVENKRARRFYEKLGLSHETTLKKHYYADKDECVYSRFF
ncbi:MAG TPA: GNAT family N-acetyltransferase [Candidatus Nanoarchaeia archaeon]|nr:GNAT family N-acetyltransferase [Candidatus Nanoarchaeia archaeon]